MFNIEKTSKRFSSYISNELNLDKDKESIINYGFISMVQTIISILLVIVVGFIFNVLIESLLVSLTISILRKSSGGAHASSPKNCAILGAIISVILGLISNHISINMIQSIIVGIIIFIVAFIFIHKLAPVDSKNKPIKKLERKKRLKYKSLKILMIYLVVVSLNYIYIYLTNNTRLISYNFCIYSGLIWQTITLTKSGHYIIKKMDILLK